MFMLKALRPERYGSSKEAAPAAPLRTFALELDLSAAGKLAGDLADDFADEGTEPDDDENTGGSGEAG